MGNVKVTLPDGTQKEIPQGTTAGEVAQSISAGLAKVALAARVDDRLVDLSAPLETDSAFQVITPSSPEGLTIYRHSSAHLLAAAVLELFPDAHPRSEEHT